MRIRGFSREKMERDKGIEPSPPPWQGGVLPLYESRVRNILAVPSFIARDISASNSACEVRRAQVLRLSIDLEDASAFHDG